MVRPQLSEEKNNLSECHGFEGLGRQLVVEKKKRKRL
jgi:hypothetical protein